MASLNQQRRQRRRQVQRGSERLDLGGLRSGDHTPAEDWWGEDAHLGESISFGCRHADPSDSAGYKIAPQASHPSMTMPDLIWLRRLSGMAVWHAPQAPPTRGTTQSLLRVRRNRSYRVRRGLSTCAAVASRCSRAASRSDWS